MDTSRFIIEIVTVLGDRGLAAFEPGPAGLVVAHVFRTQAAAALFASSNGSRGTADELCAILVPPLRAGCDCGCEVAS
jgi:hypothetical protein